MPICHRGSRNFAPLQLEPRRMLAGDVSVDVEGPFEVAPGDEVAYTIRVTNHGPGDASAVEIAGAETHLNEPSWTRQTTLKNQFGKQDFAGMGGVSIQGTDQHLGFGREVVGIGDVNGDNIDDVLVADTRYDSHLRAASDAWVVFGSAAPLDEIAVTDLDGSNGFRLSNILLGASSMAGGGDVNGDGINDFLVAGVFADPVPNGGTENGETYVIFGSATGFPHEIDVRTLDGDNGFTIRGYATADPFDPMFPAGGHTGTSVDIAGDFNGDGFADIVVGGVGQLCCSSNSAVYVVYGTGDGFEPVLALSDLNGQNGFTLSAGNFEYLGQSVAGAGDVNADGLDDIILGSWITLGNVAGTIIFGTTDPIPGQIDLLETGALGYTRLLADLAVDERDFVDTVQKVVVVDGVHDVNGDNVDDVIIGAPRTNRLGRYEVGEAYVLFGSASGLPQELNAAELDGANGFTITSRQWGGHAGRSVSGVGDFDGDGNNDIMLQTDPTYYTNGEEVAWLLFGTDAGWDARIELADLDELAAIRFSEATSARPAGDFNNDGRQDIIIGSLPGEPLTTIRFGRERPALDPVSRVGGLADTLNIAAGTTVTYQLRGTMEAEATDPVTLEASASHADDQVTANYTFLQTTHVLREVDLSVASHFPPQATPGDPVEFEIVLTNTGPAEAVGSSVSADLASLLREPNWTQRITRVQNGFPEEADLTDLPGDFSGIHLERFRPLSIINIGDLNGDALADLAVRSSRTADEGYLVFGAASPGDGYPAVDGQEAVAIQGASGNLRDLKAVGDVNGDGFADVLAQDSDAYHIIFGAARFADPQISLAALDGTNGFSITRDVAARVVIGGGFDLNQDGYDDLAIALSNDTETKVVIFAGRPTGFHSRIPLSTIDSWSVAEMNSTPGRRWTNVTYAGDVNADGVDDLLLGLASEFDFGGNAYVVYGKQEFTEPVNLRRLAAEEGFETSGLGRGKIQVGPAGDVSGDGIDDIIVALDGDEPTDFPQSSFTLVLGSADPKSFGDLERVTLRQADFGWGQTVAFAGDVNFDGVDDVYGTGADSSRQFVLFGDRDILSLDSSLEALGRGQGLVGHSPRSVGDFNGDGFHDILVDDFLLFTPTETTEITGSGDVDTTLDVGTVTRITWTVTGTLRDDVDLGLAEGLITVTAGPLRTERDVANNLVKLLVLSVPGDVDGNRVINFADFLVISSNYGKKVTSRSEGDLDGDGCVGFADFLLVSRNFRNE